MSPFDAAPKFETSSSGISSPESVELFRKTAIDRITELVVDGTYPQAYADDLIASVNRIEEAIVDPVQDALRFAEVGVMQMDRFQEIITDAEEQVVQMCNNAIEKIDELWQEVKRRKVVPINILELELKIEAGRREIEENLETFRATVDEVRSLRMELSSLTNFDDPGSSVGKLKVLLQESSKE